MVKISFEQMLQTLFRNYRIGHYLVSVHSRLVVMFPFMDQW